MRVRGIPVTIAVSLETAGTHALSLVRPADVDSLLDEEAFEREEFLPYWAELWPSAFALASALEREDVAGARVLELGCGLGVPSIVAALGGAEVLATDWSEDALGFLHVNARRNGAMLETRVVSWADPAGIVEAGPWDIVLASDVLYERRNGELLLDLLPRLGARVLLADPGRPYAATFLEAAAAAWTIDRAGEMVYRLTRITAPSRSRRRSASAR